MKITKAKLKQIIKEELSGVMEGGQEDVEKEMAAYLIAQGVYRGNPGGTVDVFTGTTGGARNSLENSGKFADGDIRTYIDKLDRQIR